MSNMPNPPYQSDLVEKVGERYLIDHLWLKWVKDLSTYVDTLNAAGTAATGTGLAVKQTTPTLVTPILGVAAATSVAATGALSGATVKATTAAGYISSDGSTGFTGTVTTASLVGKTITIKDGIITGFA